MAVIHIIHCNLSGFVFSPLFFRLMHVFPEGFILNVLCLLQCFQPFTASHKAQQPIQVVPAQLREVQRHEAHLPSLRGERERENAVVSSLWEDKEPQP